MKKIKNRFLFVTMIAASMSLSCNKSEKSDGVAELHEQFHGKYHPISSTSSEAIDVNQDGTGSVNMITEIEDLGRADLIILITRDVFLFLQFWPEQYLYGNPQVYDPNLAVNYANQAVSRQFEFSSDLKSITLFPDEPVITDPDHFARPDSVTIAGEEITVVLSKNLYSTSGWKTVKITTVYKRYTKST